MRGGAGRDQDQVSITTVQLYSGRSNVGNVSATQLAAPAAGHQAAVAGLLEAAPRLLVTAVVSLGPTWCLRWGTLQNSAVTFLRAFQIVAGLESS